MAVLNKYHGNIPKDAIYIGRPSVWGNPFEIGVDGTRAEVIKRYEMALLDAFRLGKVTTEELAALHGKDLVCFCAPQACHGDILQKYAEEAHNYLEHGIAPLTTTGAPA